jgi:hypothetical protein
MRNRLRSVLVVALAVAAAVLAVPGTASAAPTKVGYDVSYPQCDTRFPTDRPFAVVGVNGGLSTKANPCLGPQLAWAWQSSGAVPAQPRAQLYLNTANPGEVRTEVSTWPETGTTPYGRCDGSNSAACSYRYGWQRASNSVGNFFAAGAKAGRVSGAPARYTWWLDVETTNTWQSGSSEALARNRATLEGMTDYLVARGAQVGLYSTNYQWNQIVGTVPVTSSLAGRPSWLAGATTLSGARENCSKPALVPAGTVTMTQFVQDGWDRNHSCI